jgi:hypothetical protein
MKRLERLSFFLILCLCAACGYDNVITKQSSKSFEWVNSELSPPSGSFFSFSIGDDNYLYAHGFVGSDYGIYKWANNQWSSVVALKWDSLSVQSFAILKQKVYLINFVSYERNDLLRAYGHTIENIPVNGRPQQISQIDGELIMAGDFSDGSNAPYGVSHSDDGSTFAPLHQSGAAVWLPDQQFVAPGFWIDMIENRMFIVDSKGKTFEFDGTQLTFFLNKSFSLVDQQDSYYTISNDLHGETIEKTTKDGVTTNLGSNFDKADYMVLFMKDETMISINQKNGVAISSSYYFDGTDWQPINTTNYFSNAFEYNNRLFANCVGGLILELKAK